jgi:hypothetical protein
MSSSKRLYYILLSLISLLILGLVGGAYAADKLLIGESRKLVDSRLQTAVLDTEQQQLSKAKQDITKYHDLAAIAASVVPQDKDQAQTIRQIVDIAKAHSVAISSITFPTSTLGLALGKPASSNLNLSQLTPVKGISGVYDLQLTVLSDSNNPVPYSQFVGFLAALEHNRRTALISGITLQPNDKDRSKLAFTLTLDEYIKP